MDIAKAESVVTSLTSQRVSGPEVCKSQQWPTMVQHHQPPQAPTPSNVSDTRDAYCIMSVYVYGNGCCRRIVYTDR